MDPMLAIKGTIKVGMITGLFVLISSGLNLLRYADIERRIKRYRVKKKYGRINIDP